MDPLVGTWVPTQPHMECGWMWDLQCPPNTKSNRSDWWKAISNSVWWETSEYHSTNICQCWGTACPPYGNLQGFQGEAWMEGICPLRLCCACIRKWVLKEGGYICQSCKRFTNIYCTFRAKRSCSCHSYLREDILLKAGCQTIQACICQPGTYQHTADGK